MSTKITPTREQVKEEHPPLWSYLRVGMAAVVAPELLLLCLNRRGSDNRDAEQQPHVPSARSEVQLGSASPSSSNDLTEPPQATRAEQVSHASPASLPHRLAAIGWKEQAGALDRKSERGCLACSPAGGAWEPPRSPKRPSALRGTLETCAYWGENLTGNLPQARPVPFNEAVVPPSLLWADSKRLSTIFAAGRAQTQTFPRQTRGDTSLFLLSLRLILPQIYRPAERLIITRQEEQLKGQGFAIRVTEWERRGNPGWRNCQLKSGVSFLHSVSSKQLCSELLLKLCLKRDFIP